MLYMIIEDMKRNLICCYVYFIKISSRIYEDSYMLIRYELFYKSINICWKTAFTINNKYSFAY